MLIESTQNHLIEPAEMTKKLRANSREELPEPQISNRLKKAISIHLTDQSGDGVKEYFASMPSRYWAQFSEKQFLWHLENLSVLIDAGSSRVTPIIRWKHFPSKGYSEVLVCARNQHGLLAKFSGAFAASGINVLSADIFTRSDDLVVDIFQVCTTTGKAISNQSQMANVHCILTSSLPRNGDLPFADLLARSDESFKPRYGLGKTKARAALSFDNKTSDQYTILKLEVGDYLGLLHDVLQVLSLCDVEIEQARITTHKGVAMDIFYLTNGKGRKITSKADISEVTRQIRETLSLHASDL